MKKQLIALAVAAALPMGAQAGVTIYGHANAAFEYLDNGKDTRFDVSSNNSRLGFKGGEDISDSLKVFFKMEWHVSMTGDGSRSRDLAQRNRYVGLKGDWGSVLLGRHDSPTKVIGRKVDLFYSAQLGENRDITARDGLDPRLDNVVAYISPTWNGFHLFGAWSAHPTFGANGGADFTENNSDAYDIAAIYSNGGLFVAGTVGEIDNGAEWYRLVGSYKMGDFRVVGLFQNADTNAAPGDRDVWGLGASYKFGNNIIKGHYYTADDFSDASDTGADQISLGWDHKMNKRTMLYVTYSVIDNDDNASFRIGQAGHDDRTNPAAPGEEVSGLSMGLRYTF